MFRCLLLSVCLAAGPALAQSASPINPSSRPLGSDSLDNIRPYMYRPSDSYEVRDSAGRVRGHAYSPIMPLSDSWKYVPTTPQTPRRSR